MSKLDDEFEKARKLVNRKLEKSESPDEPFLSQPIGNKSDTEYGNRPTPKLPEVIPDIPKPDNLVPPPIPIPDEDEELDDEEKLQIATSLLPNKKEEIVKIIKGKPTDVLESKKKETVYELRKRLTQEVLEELKIRREAEIELEKSYLIECESCHEKTLKKRYDTCECGHKKKTIKELEKEKEKLEELEKVRKAKELRAKQLAEAKRREEKEDEELMSAFNEVLHKGNNFSKVCKTCFGIDIK
jgi:hypothetical protein